MAAARASGISGEENLGESSDYPDKNNEIRAVDPKVQEAQEKEDRSWTFVQPRNRFRRNMHKSDMHAQQGPKPSQNITL